MKIIKIRFSSLRNESWFQFFTEFKILADKQGINSLGIEDLFPVFLSLFSDADAVLELIRKSAYTAQITVADEARDQTFSGFRDVVKGMLSHFSPEKSQAAGNLMMVFDRYGNLAKREYSEETAAIYNLLQEMTGNYAPNIALLGLEEWVMMLDAQNRHFSNLIMERNEEQSQKISLRMVNIRKDLDACYVEMVSRIEAITILQPNHNLTDFVNQLNTNITRYKTMLAQRTGRKEHSTL